MSDRQHLLWQNFRDEVLAPGNPAKVPLVGAVEGEIYVEPGARLIGLRLAKPESEFPGCHDRLREIRVRRVHRHGDDWADISCDSKDLFESFYAFMLHLADLVQVDKLDICKALTTCLGEFERLVQRQMEVPSHEAIGLWGELWFLKELIRFKGPSALGAWKGPDKQIHDFRLGGVEVEVKTTVRSIRQHVIHGLNQLTPSPGKGLFLLSVHAEEAGIDHGRSVSELVDEILDLIGPGPGADAFRKSLDLFNFDWSLSIFMNRRWDQRDCPLLISVDDSFPRITKEMLDVRLGEKVQRISSVEYVVDVTGLGRPLIVPEFLGQLEQ